MLGGALGLVFKIFGLIALTTRIVSALLLKIFGRRLDRIDDSFEPTVEVVIPMFNEGECVEETIASMLALDYPAEKLRITIIDDASTDDSLARVTGVAKNCDRVRVLRNPRNIGKRLSIIRAVRESNAEIIVSVDSDCVVDPQAIRQLVRRFADPRIGAVGGRVDVRNKHDNWLTRMQVVKYWFSYHSGKALELLCRQVMCLSGCLTAYRRSVLLEVEPQLLDRKLFGQPVKYGEDRFLTRQIVFAGYQTVMTNDALCRTTVPSTLAAFQAQQLRWQRSGIIDIGSIATHFRRLNPLITVQFIVLIVLTMAYPALLIRSLVDHTFLTFMTRKLVLLAVFGLIYRWNVRNLPRQDRVSAFAILPMALVLPVIYGLLIPLGLFTLDSSNWETRRHGEITDELPESETTVDETTETAQEELEPAASLAAPPERAA